MNRYTRLYFHYLRRTGLFKFLGKNLLKLFILVGVLIGLTLLIEHHIITMEEIFKSIVENVDVWSVFVLFTLSECILGILPPDLFIIWSKELSYQIDINVWFLVGFLGLLSYIGGLTSYFIGTGIIHISKIHDWMFEKYGNLFTNLKKWGGFFVVISALLPIPFSILMLICGITGYPIKWAASLGLFRFVRFFGYAIFLFMIV